MTRNANSICLRSIFTSLSLSLALFTSLLYPFLQQRTKKKLNSARMKKRRKKKKHLCMPPLFSVSNYSFYTCVCECVCMYLFWGFHKFLCIECGCCSCCGDPNATTTTKRNNNTIPQFGSSSWNFDSGSFTFLFTNTRTHIHMYAYVCVCIYTLYICVCVNMFTLFSDFFSLHFSKIHTKI